MTLGLANKVYNPYGEGEVSGGDLVNSGKWIHAGTKLGLSEEQTTNAFDFFQKHASSINARYATGVANRSNAPRFDEWNTGTTEGPMGQKKGYENQVSQLAKTTGKDNDPFAHLRFGNKSSKSFLKDKIDYTNKNGKVSFYEQNYKTQYGTTNAMSGQTIWSDKKPTAVNPMAGGPGGGMSRTQGAMQRIQSRNVADGRGAKTTGRMINGAFVTDSAYEKMDDEARSLYGLTSNQVRERDATFDAASTVVGGAHQYRLMRSRKKTGVGAVVGKLAESAIPIAAGAFFGPGAIAAGAGVANTALQGGDWKDAALGAGKGWLSGQIGDQLKNIGGDMGLFDSIKGGIGDIFGDFGDMFKDGGALGGIGDIFQDAGKGILGDVLGGVFGQPGGNRDVNPWEYDDGTYTGGTINPGGGTGGGNFNINTGQPYAQSQPLQQGGGNNFLGQLLSGLLSQQSSGEVRDEIKSGRDRAIDLADPLADQRSGFAGQLGELMADPAARVKELPGYDFRFNEGQRAMQRTLDAGGLSGSGNALVAATQYGQNFAQAAYDSEYKKLYDLSQGSSAASQAASNAGTQLAVLEHGKYSDYSGLLSQATGGAIPNPGGQQQLPGGGGGNTLDSIMANFMQQLFN